MSSPLSWTFLPPLSNHSSRRNSAEDKSSRTGSSETDKHTQRTTHRDQTAAAVVDADADTQREQRDADFTAYERGQVSRLELFSLSHHRVTVSNLLTKDKTGRQHTHANPYHNHGQEEKSSTLVCNDSALISSLTQRLTTVETINRQQKKKIQKQENIIQRLTERIQHIEQQQVETEAQRDTETPAQAEHRPSDFVQLLSAYDQLKQQVIEMEEFLKDYGLNWIGNQHQAETTTQSAQRERETTVVEMAVLLPAIQQLNATLSCPMQIVKHGRVTRFQPPPCLYVTVYEDGLWVGDEGAVRQWGTPEADQFVSEILSGYFPLELKEKHPQGVRIHCHDQSHRTSKQSSNSQHTASVAGLQSMTIPGAVHISRDQFLSRLPNSCIVNDRVVPVRSAVAEMIERGTRTEKQQRAEGSGSIWTTVPFIDTEALRLLKQDQSSASCRPPFPASLRICAIRLRLQYQDSSLAGHSRLVLLQTHSTLEHLTQLIVEQIKPPGGCMLRWCSVYPRAIANVYSGTASGNHDKSGVGDAVDSQLTLHELGWTHTCCIYVQIMT